MVFHSLEFFFLFLFLLVLMGIIRHQNVRKSLVLLASLIFLGSGDLRSLCLFFVIAVTTYTSVNLNKKFIFPLSVFIILSSIFGSKLFISSTFYLPIGISFYGLQAMSLILDKKREKFNERISFFETMLYLSFFPQLIAGPICRVNELLPQLKRDLVLKRENIISGSNDLFEGLFLKLIIAGYLGPKVMHFINNPQIVSGPLLWFIIIFSYSCYIYTDFNSYSKMAIGLAKILGIQIPENFKTPYLQKDLKDFWRNWHITLSSWLRDYIYIPLGGHQRIILATFITFFLSSLWHGYGLNFIFWGFIHFFALMLTRPARSDLQMIFNFLLMHFAILFGWIFFAAKDLATAFLILRQFVGMNTQINPASLVDLIGLSALTFASDFLFKSIKFQNLKTHWSWNYLWPLLMFLVLLLKSDNQSFIYYRF